MAHCSAEYQRNYMRKYIELAVDCICEVCNRSYKNYRKYRHVKSKYHLRKLQCSEKTKYNDILSYYKTTDIELYEAIRTHLNRTHLKVTV